MRKFWASIVLAAALAIPIVIASDSPAPPGSLPEVQPLVCVATLHDDDTGEFTGHHTWSTQWVTCSVNDPLAPAPVVQEEVLWDEIYITQHVLSDSRYPGNHMMFVNDEPGCSYSSEAGAVVMNIDDWNPALNDEASNIDFSLCNNAAFYEHADFDERWPGATILCTNQDPALYCDNLEDRNFNDMASAVKYWEL